MRNSLKSLPSIFVLTFIVTGHARAALILRAEWDGMLYGNSTSAIAYMTIDETAIPNPGVYNGGSPPLAGPIPFWLEDFTISVFGHASGERTFYQSDYYGLILDTSGGDLDFESELIGQNTLYSPWGTTPRVPFESGEFNFFSIPGSGAPTGVATFNLMFNGDRMALISVRAVPELGSASLLSLGMISFLKRKRQKRRIGEQGVSAKSDRAGG
ncbi:hypothetical protein, partial [Roseibacillus persicicus]|uniref:hypothetical protein n=1 Tax=Roseibacillus persicicus TaxID=454148 RepID=UPI00281005D9